MVETKRPCATRRCACSQPTTPAPRRRPNHRRRPAGAALAGTTPTSGGTSPPDGPGSSAGAPCRERGRTGSSAVVAAVVRAGALRSQPIGDGAAWRRQARRGDRRGERRGDRAGKSGSRSSPATMHRRRPLRSRRRRRHPAPRRPPAPPRPGVDREGAGRSPLGDGAPAGGRWRSARAPHRPRTRRERQGARDHAQATISARRRPACGPDSRVLHHRHRLLAASLDPRATAAGTLRFDIPTVSPSDLTTARVRLRITGKFVVLSPKLARSASAG